MVTQVGSSLPLAGLMAIGGCCVAILPLAAQGPSLEELPLRGAPAPVLSDVPPLRCGTPTVIARQVRAGFVPLSLVALAGMAEADVDMGLPDGSPLWFSQSPRLIRADHPGGLTFENFLVAGDIEALDFSRWSVAAEENLSETWTRTGTSAIDGHLVSVFSPSWTHDELWDTLAWAPRGVDTPQAFWGTLRIPRAGDNEGEDEFGIWLEVAPLNLPEARVEQIDDSVQYASHVVNLVIEDFGDARLGTDNYGFDLNAVTRQFYEHFDDTYDSIAVVAADNHIIPEFAGFHLNVQNGISGLGDLAIFDNSSAYGSSGVLRSVEFYRDGGFTRSDLSHHEIGHQWVDYWEWSGVAGGVERGGSNPDSHFPLLFPGGTLVGGVLDENRRVARVGDGDNDTLSYAIEGTPAPWLYHPTTLYRMGLIGPEAVPELVVFENQKQFGDSKAVPEWGTVVEGGSRGVHINEIMARHGPRGGPVEGSSWRRATVVVSRDGLLSPAEMSYWNFYAARHAATEGTTTFDGTGSFFEATGDRVRLETEVTPKMGRISNLPRPEVSDMSIDPREFREVELNASVPRSVTAGQQLTVAGRITTTEIDDITHVCSMWERARQDLDEADDAREGEEARIVDVCDDSVAGGQFRIPFTFSKAGRYRLGLYFWTLPSDSYVFVPLGIISGTTVK